MPISKKTTEKPTPPARPVVHKINEVLATIFYALWILIGAFLLVVIVGQIRQGALSSIVGSEQQVQTPPQIETPTETDLPGIGKVNIACVQGALSQEELQKIIQVGDASTLTASEKAKLTPCIVEAESPVPSPSPNK